jgi:hypothetical protein
MRSVLLIVLVAGCGAGGADPEGPIEPAVSSTHTPGAVAQPPGAAAPMQQPLHIDFQPSGIETAAGYVPDVGDTFGERGGGLSFGWSSARGEMARYIEPPIAGLDVKLWTAVEMAADQAGTWEVALPNGAYQIAVVAGGPGAVTVQSVSAEGAALVFGLPTDYAPWVKGAAKVTVLDGKLTLTNTAGTAGNWLCYVDIAPDLRDVEWRR